jgi:hypothetical protein
LKTTRSARLLRIARHSPDHRGERRVHRLLRGAGIDAELLADLLDLLRAEVLLHDVEDGGHVELLKKSGRQPARRAR